MKKLLLLTGGLLLWTNVLIAEEPSSELQVDSEQSSYQGRKRKKRGSRKFGKRLQQSNPELARQLAEERKTWKNLSPEERKTKKKAWMKAHPEARQGSKGKNGKRRGEQFLQNNPELKAEFEKARESWKGLSKEERRAKKKAWMQAHPEARQKGKDKRGGGLFGDNPELQAEFNKERSSWKDLSRQERKIKKEQWIENHPQARESFKSWRKKRGQQQKQRFQNYLQENPELKSEWENKSTYEQSKQRKEWLKQERRNRKRQRKNKGWKKQEAE